MKIFPPLLFEFFKEKIKLNKSIHFGFLKLKFAFDFSCAGKLNDSRREDRKKYRKKSVFVVNTPGKRQSKVYPMEVSVSLICYFPRFILFRWGRNRVLRFTHNYQRFFPNDNILSLLVKENSLCLSSGSDLFIKIIEFLIFNK